MKNNILVFLILISFTSCKAQINSADKSNIISETIEYSDFKNYLHLEIKNRENLILVENDIVKAGLKINVKNLNIKIKKKSDILTKNYIEIKKIEVFTKKAELIFYYAIENIEVKTYLFKEDSWKVKKMEIIEL
ncbi:hypothetical protein [Winogradskyella psychrotolerans]|uniref:hypothetical protein n=1 Tax=Winogradskyella psychrotolerans TaxID=1344585 RepID=UPI0005931CF4|nr:hypothetical protein [Winogradskyella psychrotolerans]